MNVEVVRGVRIELSEEEAKVLCALLGGVLISINTPAARVTRDLFNLLNKALPERTETFSNFFEGIVTVKESEGA